MDPQNYWMFVSHRQLQATSTVLPCFYALASLISEAPPWSVFLPDQRAAFGSSTLDFKASHKIRCGPQIRIKSKA